MPPRKIRGHWYADFRAEGIRYRQRSPVDTRQGAAAFEAQLRDRVLRTGSIAQPLHVVVPTLAAFSKRWMAEHVQRQNRHMEQGTKATALRLHLLPVLGRERLDAIRASAVMQLKSTLVDKGLSPKSVKNYLGVLRSCLAYAAKCEVITSIPPFPDVDIGDPEHRDLSHEEQEALILAAAANPLLERLVRFKMNTGMRFSALVGLRWSDINVAERVVLIQRSNVRGHVVERTKNRHAQLLPLNDAALELLAELPRTAVGEVFTFRGQPVRYQTAYRWLAIACKTAGLPASIGWHALRHTNATELLNAGVPIEVVSVLLGHSSADITRRVYARYRSPILHDAVARLATTRSWARGGHTSASKTEVLRQPMTDSSLEIAKTSTG